MSSPPTSAPAADRAALSQRGLRVTRTRLAVLAALDQHPHADAETLHRALRPGTLAVEVGARADSISLQSIHNVLADLHRHGLIRRFEPARSPARFERRVDDNHHHAVCERCGAVEDVDCLVGQAPCLAGPTPPGFTVHTAEVTFWGTCARCAAAQSAAETAAPPPESPTTETTTADPGR